MRKVLTWALPLILVAGLVYANVDTFEGQTGTDTWEGVSTTDTREGQTVAAGGNTSCDNLGTNESYYDVDHSTDTTTACFTGGTKTVNFSGITASSDQNHTSGGTYSLYHDDTSDYASIPVNSKDIFDSAQGELDFWVRVPNTADSRYIFYAGTDVNNLIRVYMVHDEQVRAYHRGNGSADVYVESADACPSDGSWCHVEIQWDASRCSDGDGNCADAGEDELRIRINGGSWTIDTDDSDLVPFTSEPTAILWGDGYGGSTESSTFYMDDMTTDTGQPSW